MTPPTEKTPPPVRPVLYRGEPLDSERGPGLGCFRFQRRLAVLIVLAPLSVVGLAAVGQRRILFVAILLLVAGQTIIFLLRLVAADRRGRSPPTAGQSEAPDRG